MPLPILSFFYDTQIVAAVRGIVVSINARSVVFWRRTGRGGAAFLLSRRARAAAIMKKYMDQPCVQWFFLIAGKGGQREERSRGHRYHGSSSKCPDASYTPVTASSTRRHADMRFWLNGAPVPPSSAFPSPDLAEESNIFRGGVAPRRFLRLARWKTTADQDRGTDPSRTNYLHCYSYYRDESWGLFINYCRFQQQSEKGILYLLLHVTIDCAANQNDFVSYKVRKIQPSRRPHLSKKMRLFRLHIDASRDSSAVCRASPERPLVFYP